MGIKRSAPLVAAALLSLSLPAAADNFWVGVKAGTLGIGIEGAWRPIDWLDVRLGANQFAYDETGSQAGVPYDGTLDLQSYYATANLRFPLSPFRLTAGAYSNGNEINLVSEPALSYNIGGDIYTPAEVGTLRSDTVWDDFAPYLGAGFDFEVFNRLGMSFDFGVLWQGDPEVTLTSDGNPLDPDAFAASLEAERQDLEEEFDTLKAYPALSIGFHFNF